MIYDKKILGIVPARGGSKGVPNKNIRLLAGQPLIAFSIKEAQKSRFLSRCIVSSDSENIIRIAKEYGADVPFVRPLDLAQDDTLSVDVVIHALDYLNDHHGENYEYVVLLQPTTPLRRSADIDLAIEKCVLTGCDSVISMVEVGAHHPARMYTLDGDRTVNVMPEEVSMMPRQKLPPVYIRSGDIYVCTTRLLRQRRTMIGANSRALVLPRERSINIDSIQDLELAELMLSRQGHDSHI